MIKKIERLNKEELLDNSKIRTYIYQLLKSVRTPNKWACTVTQILSNLEDNSRIKAREDLARYLSNKYFDENVESDMVSLHRELTDIGWRVK